MLAWLIAAGGVVGLFAPEFGLALVLFSGDYMSVTLSGVKVIYPVMGMTLSGFLWQVRQHKRWPSARDARQFLPTALLCGLLLVSVLWSPDKLGGLEKAWKVGTAPVMGAVAAMVLSRDAQRLSRFIWCIIGIGAVMSAAGLYTVVAGGLWGEKAATALGEPYILYGRATALVFVLCLSVLLETTKWALRATLAVVAVVAFVGLLESTARGQIAAGVVPMCLLLVPGLAIRRCRVSAVLGTVAATSGLAIFLVSHASSAQTSLAATRIGAGTSAAAGARRQVSAAVERGVSETAASAAAWTRHRATEVARAVAGVGSGPVSSVNVPASAPATVHSGKHQPRAASAGPPPGAHALAGAGSHVAQVHRVAGEGVAEQQAPNIAAAQAGPRAVVHGLRPEPVGRAVMRELEKDPSLYGRVEYYVKAVRVFRTHLLVGAGAEGYTAITGINYPHNLILEFAAETGLLGLGLLAWWMVSVGGQMFRCWPGRQRAPVPPCAGAIAASLLCWFVSAQFSFNINGNRVLFLLAPILALLCTGQNRPRESDGTLSERGNAW